METIERDRTKRAAAHSTWDLCTPAVAAMLLLSLVRFSFAADTQTPRSIPHPLTMLLRDSALRAELGLRHDQIQAVDEALAQVELPLWRLRDLPASARNDPADRLITQLRQALGAILSKPQIERLDQITLRAQGIQGILEPAVAGRLKLSAVQAEKMRAALGVLNAELAVLHRRSLATGDVAAVWSYKDRAEREILAVLGDSQRNLLVALMGRPFDFSRIEPIACLAPELRDVETWINSTPLTLAQLRGHVVAVHFYTFGCINCIRNLPYYNGWHAQFAADHFKIVGIHRPETPGERVVEDVRRKAVEAGIAYPIAVDNNSANWDAWANRVWPSVYLIDKRGFVRYWWYGEMNWQGVEGEKWMRSRIQQLLAEPD
ncbi:MAG: redoxin domain-containing protein [Phycisphaerae bacterium]|nr:redoxin domain-containing protein [Phycisphaerae bacterium]